MNKKGLELPMNTIVTIVIVLFVLIGVGIFFFQQFSASKTEGFDQSQCVSMCQTAKAAHAQSSATSACLSIGDQTAKNYCKSCALGTCTLDDKGNQLACTDVDHPSITNPTLKLASCKL